MLRRQFTPSAISCLGGGIAAGCALPAGDRSLKKALTDLASKGTVVVELVGGRYALYDLREERPELNGHTILGSLSPGTSPDKRYLGGQEGAATANKVAIYVSSCKLVREIEATDIDGGYLMGMAIGPGGEHILTRYPDSMSCHAEGSKEALWRMRIPYDKPGEGGDAYIDDKGLSPDPWIDRVLFFEQSLSWSPDGLFFAWSDRQQVRICRVSDRKQIASWDGRSPTWAPDGSAIAYLVRETAFERTTKDWKERAILPKMHFVFAMEWSPCSRFLLARQHVKRWRFMNPRFLYVEQDSYPVLMIDRSTQSWMMLRAPTWAPWAQHFWLRLS